jgi:RNA polymerase sigma factor (sigma-70 family)
MHRARHIPLLGIVVTPVVQPGLNREPSLYRQQPRRLRGISPRHRRAWDSASVASRLTDPGSSVGGRAPTALHGVAPRAPEAAGPRTIYGLRCDEVVAVLGSAVSSVPDQRLDKVLAAMRREWIAIARRRFSALGDDAEDAAQTAIMKLLSPEKLRTLTEPSLVDRWARSIFVNTVLDYLRDAQRRGRRQTRDDWTDDGASLLDKFSTPDPGPEERVQRDERLCLIRECLGQLDDAWLRYAEDLPEKEVAERLGASRDAVATRLKRFRRWLRERLDEA